MGGGRWDSDKWNDYATKSYGSADRSTLRSSGTVKMTARSLDEDLDPSKAKDLKRESRDSADNPASTPIMLFTDVTGSMGHLAKEVLIGTETVCTELYDRRPVTDPHILTGAVGDAFYDSAPLQVSQFEADIRIVDQLRKLYIEGGGGGNWGESYAMAWLFAARMTATDAWEKRHEKGFLFTVGDEPLLGSEGLLGNTYRHRYNVNDAVAVTPDQAKRFLGLNIQAPMSAEEIYAEASERWEIVHICVNKSYEEGVLDSFGKVLGDRLLWLQDVAHLPELVVSTIQVIAGHDKKAVAASWSGDTSVVIADALKDIVPAAATGGSVGGPARL